MPSTRSLRSLYTAFCAGELDRRTFIRHASALGVSAAGAVFLANTAGVSAQDASPAASPAAQSAVRPTFGT